MTRARLILLAIIVLVGGCSGSRWTRVNDMDRSPEIDRTDCQLLSQRMSTERNDYTSSYSMGFFKIRENKRVSSDAIRQYFNACMYQRGWNRTKGLRKASEGTLISNGIFAVLDISVSDEDDILAEEEDSLYRIGARQLSPDIEVRLQGHMAGDSVDFVRENISTATTSKRRKRERQDVLSFDKSPESKLTIKVVVKELYQAN